ncbi:cytochrome C [Bordetella flabilis]|uniref:Cytochrome C n=2 Tax=Bordetella flabilis TaxID=463014 RepID=A0A193GFJ2_9BORD|nr:cytochrome C [Bordetella flabilis]
MRLACLSATAALLACIAPSQAADRYGLGTPATPEQIAGWNIDVFPDGTNLPPGQGTVQQGKQIYAAQCAACHGAKGEGGMGDRLEGGMGTLASGKPVRTVGSFWPYATTLFDYIRRAMPLTAPQSLSSDEVYAVTAYLLAMNGIVKDDATLDAAALAKVRMPNRDGFFLQQGADPKGDARAARASEGKSGAQ